MYKRWSCIIVFYSLILIQQVQAQKKINKTVFGSVAKLNGLSEEKGKGVIGALISRIGENYLEFDYELVPFSRSIKRIEDSEVDFQYPVIEGDINRKGILVSSFYVHMVKFGLFYHKDNKILIKDIIASNQIEVPVVEKTHENSFPFKVKPATCTSCLIKKINNMRARAGIYEISSIQYIIKKENLTNVRFVPFGEYGSRFAFKDNEKGKALNDEFEKIIKKLREDKRLPLLY